MLVRLVVAFGLLTSAVVAVAAAEKTAPTSRVATAGPVPDPAEQAAPAAPQVAPQVTPQDPLAAALQQRLSAPAAKADNGEREDFAALSAFYAERSYAPLWVSASGTTPKAASAIAEIKHADDWGLAASDFALPDPIAGNATPAALVDAEIKLSVAVLKYARYARGGRITDPATELSSYLDRKPQLLPPRDILSKIAAADAPDAVLRAFNPQHPQFEKLRQKLLELRRGAAPVSQIVRMPDGPMLKPGIKHPDVAVLRQRLNVAPPVGADATLYDATLKAAVVAYQKEKGLSPDGLVGAGTRAVLNDVEVLTPEKLLANMEEWRWMPDDMGDLYVWVNVPEFTLRIVKDGKVIHTERVITGLPDKETPIFSETMKTIIFRPRWNVPNSIKVKELWPSLARGGTYFERQGLRLSQNGRPVDPSSVDWSSTDIRRFDIYQPPGERNALGNIKFAFPNKHDVYMHDTPNKNLFNEASRPFSHGCMRVRNPERMAEILLAEDKGWDAGKIAQLIASGPENNEVKLDRKIGVHITYFTAWVDETGATQMARDVYGHEKRITLALEGKWGEIVVGPNHLAPVKIDPELRASIQNSNTFGSVGNLVQSILGGF
jgi:L,D-transpeptidase YcbB